MSCCPKIPKRILQFPMIATMRMLFLSISNLRGDYFLKNNINNT